MTDGVALSDLLSPLLPVRIEGVEFNDPTLILAGNKWSLAVMGDWLLSQDGAAPIDADHPNAAQAATQLVGSEVIGIDFPDLDFNGDCLFTLSAGTLKVTSDRSGWETWTFHHAELRVVVVGL